MGALVLLTTIMLNFYKIFSGNWETLDGTQIGIDATSLATSYFEIAHGLAFDIETYDTLKNITSPSQLTKPDELGPDEGNFDISTFNDFDDFHGYSDTTHLPGLGTYVAEFEVYYVNPLDVTEKISNSRRFTKRMNLKIWRDHPPPPSGGGIDTLRMFTVMGYFNFQ